jgi:DNA-binding transcriptional LysR family regulator
MGRCAILMEPKPNSSVLWRWPHAPSPWAAWGLSYRDRLLPRSYLISVRGIPLTSRRVELTEAGTVLLRESRKTLAAADSAVRRTRRAARPQHLVVSLRSGMGAGVVAASVDAYRQQPAAAPLDVKFTTDQAASLRDSSADIALMCSTDDLAGFRTRTVAEESAFALLTRSHPLAEREFVTDAELRADARFSPVCPPTRLDEIVDRVAVGQLVVVVGKGAADRAGSSVCAVPVSDLPVSHLVLAWPAGVPLRARDAFVRGATMTITSTDRQAS